MPYEFREEDPDYVQELRERQSLKRDNIARKMNMPRRGSPVRDAGAEPEGIVHDPRSLLVSAATAVLCKDMAAKITRSYPGWRWVINPDERGKVFNIFNLDFHDQWTYTVKYSDIQNDPSRKEAIRAAGEILERFGYTHRSRRNGPLSYCPEAMASLQRDSLGRVLDIDLTATHARNVSKQQKTKMALASAIRRGIADEVSVGDKTYLRVRGHI